MEGGRTRSLEERWAKKFESGLLEELTKLILKSPRTIKNNVAEFDSKELKSSGIKGFGH